MQRAGSPSFKFMMGAAAHKSCVRKVALTKKSFWRGALWSAAASLPIAAQIAYSSTGQSSGVRQVFALLLMIAPQIAFPVVALAAGLVGGCLSAMVGAAIDVSRRSEGRSAEGSNTQLPAEPALALGPQAESKS